MRYVPAASPALRQRHEASDGVNWSEMPMLRFSTNDDMQHRFLRSQGVEHFPPNPYRPFLRSVPYGRMRRTGMGGMIPEQQLQQDLPPRPGPPPRNPK